MCVCVCVCVCVCLRRRSTQLGGRLVHTRVSGQNISITLVLSSFLEFPLTPIGFWSSGEFPIFPHELHVSASLNSRHAEHSR